MPGLPGVFNCFHKFPCLDFNGVSLSGGDILINPDLDLAHELQGWWESEGCRQEAVTSLTVSGARGGEASGGPAKILGEVKQENIGLSERGDYYSVIATVTFFRSATDMSFSYFERVPSFHVNNK